MPNLTQTIKRIESTEITRLFETIYGTEPELLEKQQQRYKKLIAEYEQKFGDADVRLFSTPGRTEIGGNHTDHNNGRVLAASVNLDSVAVASQTEDSTITLYSEGFSEAFQVKLDDLSLKQQEQGTTTGIIRGIAARLKELGFNIGGFNACLTSNVMVGSGLSSSASIEVLIGTILNEFYNNGNIAAEQLAIIGQYAENHYFGKPCGLMDQMTCAVGGIVSIDFKDTANPVVTKVNFDFSTVDYKLLVVDTGGSHADLTDDYASIPAEMKAVAQFFNATVARELTREQVLENIPALRKHVGDRAILRVLHFLSDNQRVLEQVAALESNDFPGFLQLVQESGNSSFRWLQNCYTIKKPDEQGVSLALKLTEDYLRQTTDGACRVHGGGFAGTIQVFMPTGAVDKYVHEMEGVFGEGAVLVLDIRPVGTMGV